MAYSTYRSVQKRNYDRRVQSAYIDGNTVREFNILEEIQRPVEKKEVNHTVRKNREKALYMNLGYVLFLVAALISAAFILISYIQVQSDITLSVKNIASMERELNELCRAYFGADRKQMKRFVRQL